MPFPLRFPSVTVAMLEILAAQLRAHGSRVIFDPTGLAGRVDSIAGSVRFELHTDGILEVTMTTDAGHFAEKMLIGGMRQMVEEARELAGRPTMPTAPRP